MLKRLGLLMMVAAATASVAAAQSKAPAAKPAEEKSEQAKPAPAQAWLPINIKIEVSITDQTGTGPAARKLVSLIASDRQSANIRSSANVPIRNPGTSTVVNYRPVTINVDARPEIVTKEPNKVLVSFGLEYLPKSGGPQEEMELGMAQLSERMALVFESGKPQIVSQAADPTSDRKITVEVTATILK